MNAKKEYATASCVANFMTVDKCHLAMFSTDAQAAECLVKLNAHDDLVEALKAEHRAVDWLLARLIELDPEFMPTKSPVWPSLENTAQVLVKVGAL